jgi:hypothetical protein
MLTRGTYSLVSSTAQESKSALLDDDALRVGIHFKAKVSVFIICCPFTLCLIFVHFCVFNHDFLLRSHTIGLVAYFVAVKLII